MELRQLKYFLAVADSRSFVSAANALFVSRQAVSKAVAQLESELGVELFVRDATGALLTPAGILFYDRIRSSVMELEKVRGDMQRYGLRYQQRVRMVFSAGIMRLYEQALQNLQEEKKNMELEYREWSQEQCLDLLRERKADLAICTGTLQDPEFEVQILAKSPYGVIIQEADTLAELESLELRDLIWLPLAGVADGANETFCKTHRLRMGFTGLDLYRLYSLAQGGHCAMLAPECMFPKNMTGLRWIPLEQAEDWTLCAVSLQSLDNNILYRSTLEELQSRVFESVPELK